MQNCLQSEKVKQHTGALDRYYMEVCPGCSMPAADCKAGSNNEVACILADVREILLRIEARVCIDLRSVLKGES